MLDLLCSHMVHHVFPISAQKLPGAGQPETQITIRLMRFSWTVTIDRSRLEFPLGLPRIYTSNEGREDGGIVVVDQRYLTVGGFLIWVRTVHSFPDLRPDFFVLPVLRNQVLELQPRHETKH